MNYSKIPLAQTVVTLCKWYDIKHIVISPGSRSAPLTIGFTHDEFFTCYSIVDERCAAFFALGMAQQLEAPVALVCTSGSAVLNYYPAISEAFYSNIPVVVLSADRPKCLIDIGDGQTINQKDVFGHHVHYSANLKLDLREEVNHKVSDDVKLFNSYSNKSERLKDLQKGIQAYNETEVRTALSVSTEKSGPVHINIPFDEPLYDRVESPIVIPKTLETIHSERSTSIPELDDFVDLWNNANRKLVLIGVLNPKAIEPTVLEQLASDNSVIVFTETTSNCHHEEFFPGIDKIIAPLDDAQFEDLKPDILLTLGGMVVSKKIKAFLRTYKPKHHWHIGEQKANDTFFCLEKHFKYTPNVFLRRFLALTKSVYQGEYKTKWKTIRSKRRRLHDGYLKKIPFSDFTVFNAVLKSLPQPSMLQVGNSSAIRYTQLFQLPERVKVFCNRGTSGIDGSTSTAIGAAVVSNEPTLFITGDLSFFYDSNALWNSYIPSSFRIIVVNNNGGGIFRILPGHKNTPNFDQFFETKHQLTAQQLCLMYGLDYDAAANTDELSDVLQSFYEASDRPRLLEIFTPSRSNDTILLEYFDFIK